MTDKPKTISYFAYEGMLEKEDRQQRRMVAIIIILIFLLFFSNGYWLYKWTQFDTVDEFTVEVDSEGEGNANYIGEDGNIYNGKSESDETETENSQEQS